MDWLKKSHGMSKADIRDYRRWHRDAALRARVAGFNIIYVYAGHSLSLAMHFLQTRHNHRTDEYGGSLVNRARLLRELIEDTKEAVGADCAVAVRFADRIRCMWRTQVAASESRCFSSQRRNPGSALDVEGGAGTSCTGRESDEARRLPWRS